ncbi:uncharacterized protein BX663DRAFT_555903 [Cokeromyces recurvatus]|uniref:uncharacterized protein n=1 Tax=Cokeromyces recurvatus TaxID=90255 RepID=UPI0022209604|nr:uncharacterized protein BX663DRAFT_555903 [Cokeromyces recurvatus]KAI7898392.1 hypothetical protein BX663DRAFT_555903 [Cokeromyces recurvatus]
MDVDNEEWAYYMEQEESGVEEEEKVSYFKNRNDFYFFEDGLFLWGKDNDDDDDDEMLEQEQDSDSNSFEGVSVPTNTIFVTTDFEILAYYCPNLNELQFNDYQYWYSLNELDLSLYWKQLHKIPTIHNNAVCRSVFQQLKDRLTSLEFFFNFQPFFYQQLPLLKECTLYGNNYIHLNLLERLHQSAPFLESLYCKVDIRQSNKIMTTSRQNLKLLCCYIYDPKSVWFSLIQDNYYDVYILKLTITHEYMNKDKYSKVIPLPLARATQHISQLFDLMRLTRIRCIDVVFSGYYIELEFIRSLTYNFINNYNIIRHYEFCPVEIHFMYSNNVQPEYMPGGSYATDTSFVRYAHYSQIKQSPQRIHHRFDFHVVMKNKRRRLLDEGCASFINAIVKPVNLRTQYLTIKRVATVEEQEVTHFNYYNNNNNNNSSIDLIYLDCLLKHFPSLIELSIVFCQEETSLLKCLISSRKTHHNSIRVLNIENVKLDRNVYEFLYNYCPNLSRLDLKNCKTEQN